MNVETVSPVASQVLKSDQKPRVEQQYFSTKQAGEYLGKTVNSIEGYVARGMLRPNKSGKLLFFPKHTSLTGLLTERSIRRVVVFS